MIWINLFSQTIRQRGQQYFKKGCVKNLKMQGEQYTVTVTGNRNYRVSITVRDSRVVKMSCSCPYASDGFRCKHMAAVLYQIETGEEAEAKASEFPFQMENSGSVTDADLNSFPENYTYFDSKAMKEDMDCSEALCRTAVKMAKDKKVLMDSTHSGYIREYSDNISEMNGDVQGHVNVGRNSYPVRLFFDRKHLTKGYCGVKGCNFYFSRGYYYGRRELCVHQWALFYHLKEFLKEHPLGDATVLYGQVFLNTIRKQQARHDIPEELSAAEHLDLEPRLQADYGSWNLSFRIGGAKNMSSKTCRSWPSMPPIMS